MKTTPSQVTPSNKGMLPLLLLASTLILSACRGTQTTNTPPASMAADAPAASASPSAGLAPTSAPTFTPLPPSEGPFLLIQTDNDAYEIIDFALDQHYPVALPDIGQRISLSGALSSSRTRLKLPIQDGQVQLFDLVSGTSQTVALPQNGFDAEQTAALAQAALPDTGLTDEAALSAVRSSFEGSLSQVWWGLDDAHLLTVIPGSPTGTQLASIEIASGEVEALETLPGLVEKVSLYGSLVLLKKGYISEPGYWQDDQYAILNLTTGEQQTIALPEDALDPILAWYDPSTISIVHQSQPIGGYNFSLLDIDKMTTQLVIDGQFSSVLPYQQGLLVFRPEAETTHTVVERRDLAGGLIQDNVLPEQCTLNLIVRDKVILNCEAESLFMDPNLETTPFSGPIFQLAGSPDGATWVLVERSGQVSLLDSSLASPQPITLEGAPLEIRWLPDSSSFLYRTLGKLYQYDPASDKSALILESDLLGDYANINAVWITIPQ